jgi:hypothetical protein
MTASKSAAVHRLWRRWLIGALVIETIAAVIVAVTLQRSRDENDYAAAPIGTPQDLLVSFPLNHQPVPGWRSNPAAVGLPPGIRVGDKFASTATNAYFSTDCDPNCHDHPTTWVYGLDTRTGASLFKPIPVAGFAEELPGCNQNGPSVAVCVTTADRATNEHRIVTVIDLDRGAVTYTGPTELSQWGSTSAPAVHPVGNYRGESRLVASIDNNGVFGVGSHAELTWSVPGDGLAFAPGGFHTSDIPALTLAIEGPTVAHPGFRVLSVVDGRDLTPTAPAGTVLKRAIVYNGGFAYQFEQGSTSAGVLFYNTRGRLVARRKTERYPILVNNPAMPIILDGQVFRVYTAAGKLLASIPADTHYPQAPLFRAIGTKLYAYLGYSHGEHWQQWDLLTGRPGSTCAIHLSDYVASDGSVVLAQDEYGMTVATDMSTCKTLWQTPFPDNSIEKVGTGLIAVTHDEIRSLRPDG